METDSKTCPHFYNFKCLRSLFLPSHPECKSCSAGKDNLWLCLTVHICPFRETVNSFVAANISSNISKVTLNVSKMYLESKRRKGFHSIFLNILTAEILCLSCNCFIPDEEERT